MSLQATELYRIEYP